MIRVTIKNEDTTRPLIVATIQPGALERTKVPVAPGDTLSVEIPDYRVLVLSEERFPPTV